MGRVILERVRWSAVGGEGRCKAGWLAILAWHHMGGKPRYAVGQRADSVATVCAASARVRRCLGSSVRRLREHRGCRQQPRHAELPPGGQPASGGLCHHQRGGGCRTGTVLRLGCLVVWWRWLVLVRACTRVQLSVAGKRGQHRETSGSTSSLWGGWEGSFARTAWRPHERVPHTIAC